jgi:hypothetical protein
MHNKTNEENNTAYTQAEIKVWNFHEMPDDKVCCIYVYVIVGNSKPNQAEYCLQNVVTCSQNVLLRGRQTLDS